MATPRSQLPPVYTEFDLKQRQKNLLRAIWQDLRQLHNTFNLDRKSTDMFERGADLMLHNAKAIIIKHYDAVETEA